MAPPVQPFPVSELEQRIHTHSVNLKEKSRKLPRNFNLKDCELFELVQYSCTSAQQQMENALKSESGLAQIECFPFVRLFRRCMHKEQMFHVETTVWEGQHVWNPMPAEQKEQKEFKDKRVENMFAQYGSYFWSKK